MRDKNLNWIKVHVFTSPILRLVNPNGRLADGIGGLTRAKSRMATSIFEARQAAVSIFWPIHTAHA